MAKSNTSLLHLLLLLLSNISFQVATCGSIVKFLPGFNGPLPFVLETGYVGVGEKEDVQVFYYFIESENNPKEDPLMLWLTGGPGCSALSGLVFEIGPLEFRKEEYNGSLPNLILKPHSWTKVSSIIFVDLPVYTGFTYATTNSGSDRSDSLLVDQAHQFLKKSLQINCNGEYINVETTNVLCSRDIKSYDKCTSGLNKAHILDPLCEWRDDTEFFLRRSLIKKYPSNFLSTNLRLPPLYCRSYPYFLCGFWANDDNVRKALHIRKGSIQKWHRCSYNIPHKRDIFNSYDYHVNLSRKGIRSLIYSGDHDMSVPFLATQAWIRSLNYSIVDDWRQWHTDDQVAGYTRTYSNQMTFATVKGGGHTAPEFRPKECFDMFSRWISKRDL
ncbi:serine carboxypeptidase-like 7 isoform X3 [Lathyrus oleraceus]|uniref:serine carboxypeptidase-like 7 isoform X3 n=1 Tax=Pisum sativum TaxID=3888 RepID=UPI0021CDF6F9|nr:serine carboxypeptidase-like 7 isoform X3 [Pisum sativum]